MEFKQFVPGVLQTQLAPNARRLPMSCLASLCLLLAFAGLVAGCGGGTAIEPVTIATPEPVDGNAEQVPDSDTADGTADPASATSTPALDDQNQTGPAGQLVESTAPVEDMHGNLLTVHGVRPWPAPYAALRPIGGVLPLAGELDEQFVSATSLVAIDVSVCARTLGDVDVADTDGFFTVGAENAVPLPASGNGSLSSSDNSIEPGFIWPDVGECERGWIAAATTASIGSEMYVHYRPTADDQGQRILTWRAAVNDAPVEAPTDAFAAGQTITFNGGELEGASLVVDGWAELLGAPAGPAGTRPVALSVQACPSNAGTWPAIGLSIDGWNLAEAAPRVVADLDELTQSAGSCDNGWLIYDVPHGGRVTGAFVAERPGTPGAHWSLLGAALPDPT